MTRVGCSGGDCGQRRRLRALPGDPAARVRFRRHRVVPDDGRLADHHAAGRLSAVLRRLRRRSSASSAASRARLNLASAVEAAIACGLLDAGRRRAVGIGRSPALGSALLFAGSYTFWSQSIIAEVYALHMLLVALTLWLLLRWEQRPTLTRLGAFFVVYAIAFGNHLSMILLAPAYALFLLASAPRRMALAPHVAA